MSNPFGWERKPWDGPDRLDARPYSGSPGPIQVSRPGAQGSVPLVSVTSPHSYASIIEGVAAVESMSELIVAQPGTGARNFLMMRNSGATNLYISFGNVATVNSTLKLTTGQIVLLDTVVPQNDINCFSDAAGGQLSYSYGTTIDS